MNDLFIFFFLKQKTAYEIRLSFGGPEMCKEAGLKEAGPWQVLTLKKALRPRGWAQARE